MKILTNKGISFLEDKLNVSCISEIETDFLLTLLACGSETDLINYFDLNTIEYIHSKPKTFLIKQSELIPLLPPSDDYVIDVRVWLFNKKKNYTLCSKMEHQHLSNTIHLFEMFCTLDKLTKSEADAYLSDLKKNVIPEISERFTGVILPYKPHYDWESKLLEDFQKATENKV